MLHIQKPQQDITVQFRNRENLPLVFRLTIPAVIAQLITFLYNIVDRMYVARIVAPEWMHWQRWESFYRLH